MKDEIVKKTTGMRAINIENLSVNFEQLGIELRKELKKQIIKNSGHWVSIAFKYIDGKNLPTVMLAFFKNMRGVFTRFSYFNIKTKEEAIDIIKFLRDSFSIKLEETL